ncbi:MAG: hypothetical protein KAI47_15410, partial [Deltaproteobacteria bacterium]|nr:hypothetical protein [Deltaproteobacteria bacterium]
GAGASNGLLLRAAVGAIVSEEAISSVAHAASVLRGVPPGLPLLVLRRGRVPRGLASGRVLSPASAGSDSLLTFKAEAVAAGTSVFQMWVDAEALAEMKAGADLDERLSVAAPEIHEAYHAKAWGRVESLVGLRGVKVWLRRTARQSGGSTFTVRTTPPTSRDPSTARKPSTLRDRPSETELPWFEGLLSKVQGALNAERLHAFADAGWEVLRHQPVGVLAEYIDKDDARDLALDIEARVFDVLRLRAPGLVRSLNISDLASERILALDPKEVEGSVKNLSVGAFFILEGLGFLFGGIAGGLLASISLIHPTVGIVVAASAAGGSLIHLAWRFVASRRSSGGIS